MRILTLLFVFLQFQSHAQVLRIMGQVQDSETGEPLAFASVGFQGTANGTITNSIGSFELRVSDELLNQPVQISHIGYKSYVFYPKEISSEKSILIEMTPVAIEMSELVIRPLSPEDYIKRVVKNLPNALPTDPFSGQSYYQESFKENNEHVAFTEAVFDSYYPKYQDTLSNQHRLRLYRTAENPHEIEFMSETVEKKQAKKRRKAERKGEEFEEEDLSVIQNSFGGPDDILSMDIGKDPDSFLDSTRFKKYRYSFGNAVSYEGKELMVILFKSKGAEEHLKSQGQIYIDLQTDAFVGIEFTADIKIPIIAQPILFALGLSINEPKVEKKLRYQLIGDQWYPKYFYIHADIGLKKRHLFSKNEQSSFEFDQVLNMINVDIVDAKPIPESEHFTTDKDWEEQLHNDNSLDWDEVNVIRKTDPL